jgi:octaprenyl-diphosphate synthase
VYLLEKGPIRVTTTVSALRPSGAASPKEAVDTLVSMLSDDMAAVDQLIHQHMDSTVGLIPNLASYLIEAGGKRLRPMLTLATAKLFGGGGAAPRKLAAAVEFIHSATLLHDDVVDGSDLRRGKKAANHVWGDKASVLVGDFLFARAFNMMVEAGSLAILDVLAKASSVIAEGEVMQLAAANDAGVTRERYMAIVERRGRGPLPPGRPGPPSARWRSMASNLALLFNLWTTRSIMAA